MGMGKFRREARREFFDGQPLEALKRQSAPPRNVPRRGNGRYVGFCFDYSCGPAETSALPASLLSYLTKFFWKREARSLALTSQSAGFA